MSCITGHTHRVTGVFGASAQTESGVVEATSLVLSGVVGADTDVLTGVVSALADRACGVINAHCSVVCFVNSTLFLRVEPQENVWLDVGESVDYSVYSNTTWQMVI